jgi:hypothetical protein
MSACLVCLSCLPCLERNTTPSVPHPVYSHQVFHRMDEMLLDESYHGELTALRQQRIENGAVPTTRVTVVASDGAPSTSDAVQVVLPAMRALQPVAFLGTACFFYLWHVRGRPTNGSRCGALPTWRRSSAGWCRFFLGAGALSTAWGLPWHCTWLRRTGRVASFAAAFFARGPLLQGCPQGPVRQRASITEMRILCVAVKQDAMSYSACQTGPTASYWFR